MLRISSASQRTRWLIQGTQTRVRPRFLHHGTTLNRSALFQFPQNTPANRFFSASRLAMNEFRCKGPGTLDDVIARSKIRTSSKTTESSESQEPALDLPDLPPITAKRPFHVRHEELEAHLGPLLSCHWHVDHVAGKTSGDLNVLSLNKLFGFKDFRSAVQFFDALADIQDEESHHARVTVDYSNVYVTVHTHVALQPTPESEAGESKPIKVPGLTARDVRFAVKVEKLHQRFLEEKQAVTKVPVDSESIRVWSIDELRQRYPPLHGRDREPS